MSERMRVAILTGCLFVIGLHLEQSGRLLLEVWRGPYAVGADAVLVATPLEASPAPDASPTSEKYLASARRLR